MRDRADGSPYQLKRFKYNSHDWILRWLSGAKVPSRILDVGAADGYLGAILKRWGHFVVGVENDPVSAARARGHYDEFHVADVEEFAFPCRYEFDYILFADVLEHLREPAAVLKKSLPSLKANGQIILSVPNLANIVMRLSLLGALRVRRPRHHGSHPSAFFYFVYSQKNAERLRSRHRGARRIAAARATGLAADRRQMVCAAARAALYAGSDEKTAVRLPVHRARGAAVRAEPRGSHEATIFLRSEIRL